MRSVGAALAATLAILGASSSCSQEGPPGDPASELRSALELTLAAESFHVDSELEFDGEVVRLEADYAAPDRFALTTDGESWPSTIAIGRDLFASVIEEPGHYYRTELPCDVPVEAMIDALAAVRHAEGVALVGGMYTFRVPPTGPMSPGGVAEVKATISEGYLVFVHLRYDNPAVGHRVVERHVFGSYGEDITIEAPSPAQVIENVADPLVSVSAAPPMCP